MPHFECGAFDHSATSPNQGVGRGARGVDAPVIGGGNSMGSAVPQARSAGKGANGGGRVRRVAAGAVGCGRRRGKSGRNRGEMAESPARRRQAASAVPLLQPSAEAPAVDSPDRFLYSPRLARNRLSDRAFRLSAGSVCSRAVSVPQERRNAENN
jgi:hypothetical protein